ncbi:DnaD domain-containing protein [Dubosiella newyorkensis]|uniref:DnaD domain-containing protein n=1 Tax=Dubosiella newyorkensis TaxID=1862672 RepID=UPI00272E0502|nr:DnaD domain protein [Dubosiella newyorkensis]
MAKKDPWNEPWFNQVAWLFAHLEDLHLDAREALIALLILDANAHNLPISPEVFAAKAKISEEEVDTIFNILSSRGYLKIDVVQGKVCFLMDGLMKNANPLGVSLSKSIISDFEEEFGRDLSVFEMQKILDLCETFGERQVVCALNEAVVYDKKSLNYIENVLVSWRNKGLSTEELESGKR